MIRSALLAVAFVATGASNWDPTYIATLDYPGGRPREEVAAVSRTACEALIEAWRAGRWPPAGELRPADITCRPGNRFEPGWDRIRGR